MSGFELPLCESDNQCRLVILPNGLKILFISSPHAEYFSIAAAVRTGSLRDPPQLRGLAHLCEHMLFTGTEKFPIRHQFYSTLLDAGGEANAYTTGVVTNFFMEVPQTSLEKSKLCSHFLSFFASPLFKKEALVLEISAIEEEHALNCGSVLKILYHAMKLMSSCDHGFHRFYTGTTETLHSAPKMAGTPVRKLLQQYFADNFVASNISIVVKGSEKMANLEACIPYTSGIASGHCRQPVVRNSAFVGQQHPKCVWVQNDTESCVRIFYPFHTTTNTSETKLYMRMWALILGDEAPGTMCEHLIRKSNWATAISCHIQTVDYTEELLVIDITPTHRGYLLVDKLIQVVVDYVNSTFIQGPETLGKILEKKTAQEETQYKNKEPLERAMDDLCAISESLSLSFESLQIKNTIRGYDSWYDIAPRQSWTERAQKMIDKTKGLFELSLMYLVVLGRDNTRLGDLFGNTKDIGVHPQYDFLYKIFDIKLHTFKPAVSTVVNVPGFMSSFSDHFSKQSEGSPLLQAASQPILHLLGPNLECWTHTYLEQYVSKLRISFEVLFASLPRTAETNVMLDLFSNIVGNSLRHELYTAEEYGVQWSICPNLNQHNSICFHLFGLTEYVHEALSLIVRCVSGYMSEPKVSNTELRKARTRMRGRYDEFASVSGLKQVLSVAVYLLEPVVFSLEERVEILEEVDIGKFHKFCNLMLNTQKYSRLLLSGGVDTKAVTGIQEHLSSLLGNSNPSQVASARKTLSFGNRSLHLAVPSPHRSTTTMAFVEFGRRNDTFAVAAAYLIGFLLAPDADRELRSDRCLGYYVDAAPQVFSTSVGIRVVITSAKHTSKCLEHHLVDFLGAWSCRFADVSEIDLVKQNFIDSYLKSPRDDTLVDPPSCPVFRAPFTQGSANLELGRNTKMHLHHWGKIVTGSRKFGGKFGEEEITEADIADIPGAQLVEFVRTKLQAPSALVILGDSIGQCEAQPKRSWLRRSFDVKRPVASCSQITHSTPVKSILMFRELIKESELEELYGMYED